MTLVRSNPDLYAKALKRGKYEKRLERSMNTVGSGKHGNYQDQ